MGMYPFIFVILALVNTTLVPFCKYTFISNLIKIDKSWKIVVSITYETLEGLGPFLKFSTLLITLDLQLRTIIIVLYLLINIPSS